MESEPMTFRQMQQELTKVRSENRRLINQVTRFKSSIKLLTTERDEARRIAKLEPLE